MCCVKLCNTLKEIYIIIISLPNIIVHIISKVLSEIIWHHSGKTTGLVHVWAYHVRHWHCLLVIRHPHLLEI